MPPENGDANAVEVSAAPSHGWSGAKIGLTSSRYVALWYEISTLDVRLPSIKKSSTKSCRPTSWIVGGGVVM
eukprot:CAMPEP_0182937226 /NCGR_PEP_ID=MMETSP0105_2-20130417/41702_1 /TAXON_ID=81532 ORGANISM="Acanthoeca-like sp., Strain 10tr" /NCGR_SAMPLE_ID=MMETSP0105_2 /ASSEMBLY_ACC=CAM_ASM_000205 /LENGTH=71 /DNA_ID=CAMNT_0025076405 /DNA_START=251 /DNA_END=466 /DNA_ORIENTATION=-